MSIIEICLIIIAIAIGLPLAICILLLIGAACLAVFAALLEKYEDRKREQKGGE